MMEKNTLSSFIKQTAITAGFNFAGITQATHDKNISDQLRSWLGNGYQATMSYMEKNAEKRADASVLVPGAKSVIVMLASYYPYVIQDPGLPQIAKYAYGYDYHEVLKRKMKLVWDAIKRVEPTLEGRMFTDSAPLHEKSLAQKAGLGWIGKNSCLIHREAGSFVFICEMVVNLELEYDQPFNKNHCGTCTCCIDACPTKAIVSPGVIDSRRCISFLTIENKDKIPAEFKGKLSNRIFGCDICQDVCPWNKKNPGLKTFEEFALNPMINQSVEEWKKMTGVEFENIFRHSPIKRAGIAGIHRNINFLDLQ
jgi:epoxyqueuosine reductase